MEIILKQFYLSLSILLLRNIYLTIFPFEVPKNDAPRPQGEELVNYRFHFDPLTNLFLARQILLTYGTCNQ